MELWAHQKAGVHKARLQNDLALFYEVGTGKTGTMINILREEYNAWKRVVNTLIFAPLSVCPQWKVEFQRFSKIKPDDILVLTGTGKKRAMELQNRMQTGRPCIVVTNYEATQIKEFYAQLLRFSPEVLILDESHKIKDASTSRAKRIYPLADAARRKFLLTGTPILNDLTDVFGQFKALNPRIFGGNFFAFRNRYFYDKNAGMPKHVHFPDWQPRPGAAEEIGQIIGQWSVQAKKSQCLDLPPLLKVPVPVELSPDQLKAYRSMEKQFVAEVAGQVSVAEFAMTKTMRLQQILAGFIIPDGEENSSVWFKDSPRLKALEDLLDSIGPSEKVIVWSVFRPTYQEIGRICTKLGRSYAFLTGDQSANQKQQSIESFCRGPVQVLIANPAAGGAGINLTEAKYAIYYTRGYSLEQYLQSEARNYRGGSDMHDKITHHHLVATDTLDEVIANALLNKQSVAERVLAWAVRNNA